MTKKKIAGAVLALLIAMGLLGCGTEKPSQTRPQVKPPAQTIPQTQPVPSSVPSMTEPVPAGETTLNMLVPGMIQLEAEGLYFIADDYLELEVNGESLLENRFLMADEALMDYADTHILLKAKNLRREGDSLILSQQFVAEEEICVVTPYGVLHYPEQWVETLEVRTAQTQKDYTVAFCCREGERVTELFRVSFGQEVGTPLGRMEWNGQRIGVYLLSGELPQDASEIVYSMADGVNVLLEKLMEDPNFRP